jgi:hypothetical protein
VAPRYIAPRYNEGFRGHDRDDHNRGRGERFENHGREFGNGFRR